MAVQVGGGGVGLIFPMAPLFIYLIMLMVFNFVISLGAVILKPNVGHGEFLRNCLRKLMMLALAKFCYITDNHLGDIPGFDGPTVVALGPLATGWFIVHVAITTLEACEQAEIPIGPLAKVLAVLKAKQVDMSPPSNENLAARGPLTER